MHGYKGGPVICTESLFRGPFLFAVIPIAKLQKNPILRLWDVPDYSFFHWGIQTQSTFAFTCLEVSVLIARYEEILPQEGWINVPLYNVRWVPLRRIKAPRARPCSTTKVRVDEPTEALHQEATTGRGAGTAGLFTLPTGFKD
jgi:hypothetical protein